MKNLLLRYALMLFLAMVSVSAFVSIGSAQTPGTPILGRPTDSSVTVNMLMDRDLDVYFEYGNAASVYVDHTDIVQCPGKKPVEVVIDNLRPNTQYYYHMLYRQSGGQDYAAGEQYTFHTQRSAGTTFTFVVEADPHLDAQSDPEIYRRTLLNELNDNPDFLIDLGDTFMSDKLELINYEAVENRHLELRSYFDLVCHSLPLFLVIGNHEGEQGWKQNGTAENIAVWATTARKLYYPNPVPDDFYAGSTTVEDFVGLRESYYAWEWGDALFVVLDPYWYTTRKPGKNGDGWNWTLGYQQ